MNEYRDSGRPDNSPSASEYDFTDYPPAHTCEHCGDRKLTNADANKGEGVNKCPDCDLWYCDPQCLAPSGLCKPCDVDAEAAKLEAQIEANKESLLRVMNQ